MVLAQTARRNDTHTHLYPTAAYPVCYGNVCDSCAFPFTVVICAICRVEDNYVSNDCVSSILYDCIGNVGIFYMCGHFLVGGISINQKCKTHRKDSILH